MILNDLVPKKPNKIAFLSIPDYSDNPRFLYEFMRQDQEDLEYIWIVNDREILQELIAKKIKAVRKNSIMGFFTLASSKVLIGTHNNMISVKGKKQYFFNLWHGIGPKTVPAKCDSLEQKESARCSWNKVSYSITTSRAAVPHYFEFFDLPEDRVKFFGYARHEFLSKKRDDHEYALSLRHNLCSDKVLLRKKWILLAPTYREEGRDLNDEELQMINKTVQDNGGLLMLRAHPVLGKRIEANHRGIVDVTSIRDITEYLPAFDGLVTDYSSIAYDFAVLRKPMVFYLYDYEEMNQIRGLNFACPNDYPGHVAFNVEELELALIEVMKGNSKNIDPVLKKFYPQDIESACRKTTEFIMSLIGNGDSHE